jgi:hypothetical protein
MNEIVFEVIAEGGSLSVVRRYDSAGERFLFQQSEINITEERMADSNFSEYATFDLAFSRINTEYPWFQLHLVQVHSDYRINVLEGLVKSLNQRGVQPEDLAHSKATLEEKLAARIEFGASQSEPVNVLQHISINLQIGSTTEYEYNNYSHDYFSDSVRSDDLKVWKKIERFDYKTIKCQGVIEFSGPTVIIKDIQGCPIHVFHSDKVIISTEPVLSNDQGWFYTNV